MTVEQKLGELGLKENEVRVYLAALELGEALVGQIEKQTGLHKQLIYNAATNLQKMGLLNVYEINGRKRFNVQDPGALEERARVKLREAEALVPELLDLASSKRSVGKLRIWREQSGVQQYYLETLHKQPKQSVVKILGVTSERFFKLFPQDDFAYERLEELRREKKISWQVLLFGGEKEEAAQNQGRRLLEIRVIKEAVRSPIDLMIWHDRVGILIYGDEPYVIDLAGAPTVEGFRQYFEVLWKQGKAVGSLSA